MIERTFVGQKLKEFAIKEFIDKSLGRVGHSGTKLQKTPLGEKITIAASRPGLVVGKSGANISRLTRSLKEEFSLENPQIELAEIEDVNLDAQVVAETIASALERFGSKRFKGIGHRVMRNVMDAGALGIEIIIAGKLPGSRAKSWRFYQGYLKKCGDIAVSGVRKAQSQALLKTGIIGIKVSIMPATTVLPDKFQLNEEVTEVIEETKDSKPATPAKQEKAPAKKRAPRKKATETKKAPEAKQEAAKPATKKTASEDEKKETKDVKETQEIKETAESPAAQETSTSPEQETSEKPGAEEKKA